VGIDLFSSGRLTEKEQVKLLNDIIRQLNLFDDMVDALERIQQQLAIINEDNNLTPGERQFE